MNIERKLIAPLRGVLIPIDKVPDPVFAEKMVGDGVSIDPLEGILRAPCDGEIVHLHESNHAVTIKTSDDVEIILHIGLDTVLLKGEGFTPRVKSGESVKAGDVLIEFDMKVVGLKAPYLLTEIVISTMDKVASIKPATADLIESGENLLTYEVKSVSSESAVSDCGKRAESGPIYLPNPVGLHARPAAVLTKMLSGYSSKVELVLGDKVANARSVSSLMKLNSSYGDEVKLVAIGEDSEEVIKNISPEIKKGLGDEGVTPLDGPIKKQAAQAVEVDTQESAELPNFFKGTSASAGLVVGSLCKLEEESFSISKSGNGYDAEKALLDKSVASCMENLDKLYKSLVDKDPGQAAIFLAHKELLEDPELLDLVEIGMKKGDSAPYSWNASFEKIATELSELQSEVLAERANDMRDVGKRVLRSLLNIEDPKMEFPENSIIVAEELTPSVTAGLDTTKVKGFCTVGGGATSHVAILARAMGLPAIVGIDKRVLSLDEGMMVVLNGTEGVLKLNPDASDIEKIKIVQEKTAKRKAVELENCQKPATTVDNHSIEVVGNVGNVQIASQILPLGGEGVGLLRSEFLFHDRCVAPSEDEQYEAYRSVVEAVGKDKNIILRTLDVGGDKPLNYLPLPKEENPFLGQRGIRVCLDCPQLLRTQLRALLRASVHGKLHIMFPMISDIQELREAKAILEEERASLGVDPVPVGIMIEVPAAAVMADIFAKEVDFFSIGTNDLTQYTLAMDRGNPLLAAKADNLHPAVLRMIKLTVDAAHKAGKWVGVCGGLASDPQAVPLLVGLGVDELSVSIPTIPSVKAIIRSQNFAEMQALAEKALASSTAQEVRDLSPNPYSDEQL
ncbi:MAG: phosphoenolpyruvate--protein phosphotransferase [Spirochaetales bacterium]|nr:phosphoenolpyruvate--protein phosphotransferase [Spirochaetales bacterium]